MDDLDHSVHIAEHDWDRFYRESEACCLPQARLAHYDDARLSDPEDAGSPEAGPSPLTGAPPEYRTTEPGDSQDGDSGDLAKFLYICGTEPEEPSCFAQGSDAPQERGEVSLNMGEVSEEAIESVGEAETGGNNARTSRPTAELLSPGTKPDERAGALSPGTKPDEQAGALRKLESLNDLTDTSLVTVNSMNAAKGHYEEDGSGDLVSTPLQQTGTEGLCEDSTGETFLKTTVTYSAPHLGQNLSPVQLNETDTDALLKDGKWTSQTEKERWFVTISSPLARRRVTAHNQVKKKRKKKTSKSSGQLVPGSEAQDTPFWGEIQSCGESKAEMQEIIEGFAQHTSSGLSNTPTAPQQEIGSNSLGIKSSLVMPIEVSISKGLFPEKLDSTKVSELAERASISSKTWESSGSSRVLIEPDENFTELDECFINPVKSFTGLGEIFKEPGSNLTEPSKSFTETLPNFTELGDSFEKPGESFTEPGERLKKPSAYFTNPVVRFKEGEKSLIETVRIFRTPGKSFTEPGGANIPALEMEDNSTEESGEEYMGFPSMSVTSCDLVSDSKYILAIEFEECNKENLPQLQREAHLSDDRRVDPHKHQNNEENISPLSTHSTDLTVNPDTCITGKTINPNPPPFAKETPPPSSESTSLLESAVDSSRPVYAISSFWDEMERLTIDDILHLRLAGATSPPGGAADLEDGSPGDTCPPGRDADLEDGFPGDTCCSSMCTQGGSLAEPTEVFPDEGGLMDTSDTTDSDYFSHLDDPFRPDLSSCEFSSMSDFDEDYLHFASSAPWNLRQDGQTPLKPTFARDVWDEWEVEASWRGTPKNSETLTVRSLEAPSPQFPSSDGLRWTSRGVSNIQTLAAEIQADASLPTNLPQVKEPLVLSNHFKEEEESLFMVEVPEHLGKPIPLRLKCKEMLEENGTFNFPTIVEYLFTEEQRTSLMDTAGPVVSVYDPMMCGPVISVYDPCDVQASETHGSFRSRSGVAGRMRDNGEPVPIFSWPRSASRDVPFSKQDNKMELLLPHGDTVGEKLEGLPTQAVSHSDRDLARGYSPRVFADGGWTNLLALSRVRFPGTGSIWWRRPSAWPFPTVARRPDPSFITTELVDEIAIEPIVASFSPLPPVAEVEDQDLREFLEQQRHLTDLRTTVFISKKDCFLFSLKQSDMCLVCIAFASWVVKSSNPQSADTWKTALLANVSAISAIQYLRRCMKKDTSEEES